WEVLMQRDTKLGHVARGGLLLGVRQAVRVAEYGTAHAELTGLGGHHYSEVRFRTTQRLGDCGCNVIGGLGYEAEDGLLKRDAVAGADAHLGWWLGGCLLGEGDTRALRDLARLHRLEDEIKGHHLGQRRRVALGVGIVLIE